MAQISLCNIKKCFDNSAASDIYVVHSNISYSSNCEYLGALKLKQADFIHFQLPLQ